MKFIPQFVRNIITKAADAAGSITAQWTTIFGGESSSQNPLEANKEWVFIATDKNAKSLSSVRFKVMRYKSNGDDQEVFEGPMVDFLENPADNFTGKDFLYLNTVYKELTGNAFWEWDKKRIKPMVPTGVTPIIDNGVLIGYRYHDGKSQRVIQAKNVLHDRYVDPAKPYWGVGKLSKIARWVDTSSYANEFLRRFFINGATFGGFIETEEESETRIKLIKVGLANDHVGVNNAHKIGVLPKGSKFSATTANMSEIEMGATDDRYRDKILAAFGVPKTLVGLTTEVNRASAEASEYIYAKYTIKPIADDLVEFLNTNVAPLLDNTGKYYFGYEEFVPINMEIELKEREIALNRQPYMTVNEVRASVGLPKVPGGDTIYGNPFQLPLGTPAASPDPAAEDDEDDEDEPKKAAPAHVRKTVVRERALGNIAEAVSSLLQKGDIKLSTKDIGDDAAEHKSFVSRVESYHKIVADKVRDFNNLQQRQVIQRLNQLTKAISKSDIFEDMAKEIDVMIDFVSPLLKGLLIEQAMIEYQAQGFDGNFDSAKDTIKRTVALAAKRLAKSYNNTTANLIKQELNDGIAAGDGIPQLAERVNKVFEYSNVVRAEMVARSETFYIANEGSKEAYKQSGVVETLRWYTAEDEAVCEFCGPQDGKIIGVNETFYPKGTTLAGRDGGSMDLNYRAIDVPPLHVNCRCFIRPERIEVT